MEQVDPRLKYLFDKGYTPESIKAKQSQGIDPLNLYYFERGYSPQDVQVEQNKLKEGFLKRTARGILEPVATILARPVQLGKALTGAETPEEQGISLPFLGRIESPTTSLDVVKDIGRGIETVSLGVGVGGGMKVGQSALKGAIKQGAKEGLKYGAIGGGMISFGQAIQEAENTPADVAFQTLFGTAAGGLTGATLGAAFPIAGKVVNETGQTIRKLTTIEGINNEIASLNTKIFRPTNKMQMTWEKQGVNPLKTYAEVFGTELPKVDADNRFVKESVQEMIDRVDEVYRPAAEAFNTILRNSPEVNSIRVMGERAMRNLESSSLTAQAKAVARKRLNAELNALKAEARRAGQLFGDDNVPVALVDNWKDRYFFNVNKFAADETSTMTNAVNRSLGFSFKEGIEDVIKDLNVKNFNKQLQQYIVLKDYLGSLNGKLSGTGGRMTRLVTRGVGAVAGSQGGPVMSTIGALTGDKLAQIWINPNMSPYRWAIAAQLKRLAPAERAAVLDEANAIIKKMFEKRMSTLALPPAPELGTAGRPFIMPQPTPEPPRLAPARKISIQNSKTGRFERAYTSEVQSPAGGLYEYFENLRKTRQRLSNITEATKNPTNATNSNIPPTVPSTLEKSTGVVDNSWMKNTQGGKIKIGSEDIPEGLMNEARKYKTAEEFVAAQFSKKPEYGMSHRPRYEGMPPAHNLLKGETLPRDVYTHPDYSIASGRIKDGDRAANESWSALLKIKGKPEAEITVYRAGRAEKLNIGDWVTFSKDYAKQSLEGDIEKVYSFKVKAKDIIFAGDDINEFGYYPKSQLTDIWNKANRGTDGGYVKIGNKIIREIDEPTKREIVDAIDYIKMGRFDSNDMEKTVDLLIEKFGMNPDWSKQKIIATFKKLLDNTKTKSVFSQVGSVATSPLGIGAGVTAVGAAALKVAEKMKE